MLWFLFNQDRTIDIFGRTPYFTSGRQMHNSFLGINPGEGGGGGGYSFSGNSAGLMFNYFANGGSVDGLSFNKGYAIWSTMDDAKSNMYYDGDQMLSGDTGGISFHRAKFSSDFSQTMSNISWLANTLIGAGATANIPGTGAFRNNEIWHVTKTKGTSFVWQDRWRNPGAKYWRGQQVRAYEPAKRLGNKLTKAGGVLLAADIAMSGEVKPSHAINAFMLGISGTGIGSIVAGAWFVADMGTGAVNYLNGNGFNTLSDVIDKSVANEYGKLELYDGLY